MGSVKTVMVVEDDAVSRLMLSRFLEKMGYSTCTAENGQEALEALSQGISPDVILMDVQMPVLDGLETTLAIRRGDVPAANPSLPIVAVTAHAMQEDKARYKAVGMDGFMPKPVDIDALALLLERMDV